MYLTPQLEIREIRQFSWRNFLYQKLKGASIFTRVNACLKPVASLGNTLSVKDIIFYILAMMNKV